MVEIKKAAALILKDKKFLIVKPHGKPYFINPGGKYEEGESPEDCLKRELMEELQVALKSFKHYKDYYFEKAAHSNDSLFLEVYIVEIQGRLKPSAEIETMEWLGKDDFINKKFNLAPSFNTQVPDLIYDGLI